MTARLIRLAAFQNPEFYRAQAMHFPTFGKPRIISCAELHPRHLALPRGCLDEAGAPGAEPGIGLRGGPTASASRFQRRRVPRDAHSPQEKASTALLAHDYGVLAATTAFGKTVVALR